MKKLLLSLLASTIYTSTVSAQSCQQPPTCAEMGYTKSESDCTGKTTLKCPFDLTKVSCDDASESSKGIIDLDWNNATAIYAPKSDRYGTSQTYNGFDYVMSSDGCVLTFSKNLESVNNVSLTSGASISSSTALSLICMKKDETYSISGSVFSSYFIPFRE